MKIRKTRIKKTTKANGSVYYVAEYKWGFWWYQFSDIMSPDTFLVQTCYKWLRRATDKQLINSEEVAKALIDFYIERVKYQNACEMENKVVKVEYDGYP